jgi:PAS domain-containing protein
VFENDGIDAVEVFRSLPMVAMMVDTELRFVAVTRQWEAHTNRRFEEVAGRKVLQMLPNNPNDPDSTSNDVFRTFLERTFAEKAFLTKPVQRYDIEIPGQGWVEKYYMPAFSPVLNADGEAVYVIHAVTDITELVTSTAAARA